MNKRNYARAAERGPDMEFTFNGMSVSVSGEVPARTTVGFMRWAVSWTDTSKDITWEQVKPYPSMVRVLWLRTRLYRKHLVNGEGVKPPTRELLREILTTQCASVVKEIFVYKSDVLVDLQEIMAGLDLQATMKLAKRLAFTNAGCEHLAQFVATEHLPVLITMDKELGKSMHESFVKELEKRKKGE